MADSNAAAAQDLLPVPAQADLAEALTSLQAAAAADRTVAADLHPRLQAEAEMTDLLKRDGNTYSQKITKRGFAGR